MNKRTISGATFSVVMAALAAGCGSADGGGEETSSAESAASTTLAFSPASHSFGTVAGGSSVTASFTLTNTGKQKTGAITLGLSGSGIADFHVASSTCGASLAAKASCTVAVAFAPPAGAVAGSQSATLTASSTSGAKAHASLTGTVAAALHSIGGTIAGLQGAGLTLTDGVDTVQVPGGSTSFTFPTKRAAGTTYAVTVTAQPVDPSQTCTVANGTGTVGTSDVSVAVSCVASAYPLSITVVNGTCQGGYCALQCASIPLVLGGSVSSSVDAAGSYTATGATYQFPNAGSVKPGSTVDVQYVPTAGTLCTCSFDPNDIHAQCPSWGCPMTVVPQQTVSGPIQATLYCAYPIT